MFALVRCLEKYEFWSESLPYRHNVVIPPVDYVLHKCQFHMLYIFHKTVMFPHCTHVLVVL